MGRSQAPAFRPQRGVRRRTDRSLFVGDRSEGALRPQRHRWCRRSGHRETTRRPSEPRRRSPAGGNGSRHRGRTQVPRPSRPTSIARQQILRKPPAELGASEAVARRTLSRTGLFTQLRPDPSDTRTRPAGRSQRESCARKRRIPGRRFHGPSFRHRTFDPSRHGKNLSEPRPGQGGTSTTASRLGLPLPDNMLGIEHRGPAQRHVWLKVLEGHCSEFSPVRHPPCAPGSKRCADTRCEVRGEE